MNIDLGVIEAPTVKELFIQKMAGLIISGDLKPGDKLPTERELAQQTRISRSIVHLGMVELERTGFIKINARQGAYVCDFSKTGNLETLNLLTRSNGFEYDRGKIIDILEMREGIERQALIRLSNNLTEENIRILKEDVDEADAYAAAKDSIDVHHLARLFFQFHHDICICSGNFILPLLFNTFRDSTTYFWEQPIRELGSKRCIELLHGMFDSILTGDSETSIAFLQKELEIYAQELLSSK